MIKSMSEENLKKFIKKYKDKTDAMEEEDAAWLDGANELMAALKINVEYLEKFNELNN
jgi:hypothetical protein